MVHDCTFHYYNGYFVSLFSEYIEKGDINDDDGKLSKQLIKFFDEKQEISRSNSLYYYLFWFLQLCVNGDVKLSKSAVEEALNQCKNEKCKHAINQYNEIINS